MPKSSSGLEESVTILQGIPNFGVLRFLPEDIVRHYVVKLAVSAYAEKEEKDQALIAEKKPAARSARAA